MKEKLFHLTPKGFLAVKTNRYDGHVWDELVRFCKERCEAQGMVGIPCLVLTDGGYCITVEKLDKPIKQIA